MSDKSREEALEYHSEGRPGKIEVVPTKPTATQRDLSLAYTPGVAVPCLDIAANPSRCLQVHEQRQSRRRHHQRHGRPGAWKHRTRRRQAGDGREGRSLQALRRHRRLRHRSRHARHRGVHPLRQAARADVRRHQPRRHRRAGVLRDRRAAEGGDEDPGLPRRSARHGHHLRGGARRTRWKWQARRSRM